MRKLWSGYRQLLRVEALIGIGFFAGCFWTGLLVGLGHFR